jgi:hypothetical protein
MSGLPHVRLSRALAVLGMLAFLATACSKPSGTITGHLYRVGGPAPGLPSPMPGTIYISGQGSVHTGADGSFSMAVPAGTYTLSGRSGPITSCHGLHKVIVQAKATVKMDVICDIR